MGNYNDSLSSDALEIVIQHQSMPVLEFAKHINEKLKISPTEFLFLKLLSAHCILNIFHLRDRKYEQLGDAIGLAVNHEFDDLDKSVTKGVGFNEVLPKQQAYDCYFVYFQEFYKSVMHQVLRQEVETAKVHRKNLSSATKIKSQTVNVAEFGKLIKRIYKGNVKSRRIGGRARSKYCYSNLSIRKKALEDLKKSGVNVITNEDINDFQVGEKTPTEDKELNLELESLDLVRLKFKSFLENDDYLFQMKPTINEQFEDEGILKLLQMLHKSDMLLKNFIHSTFNEKTNLETMCKEWDELNVMQIIKESVNINLDADTLLLYDLMNIVSDFKLVFQPMILSNEDLIYGFFKIKSAFQNDSKKSKDQNDNKTNFHTNSHEDDVKIFKNNITHFLLTIISLFRTSFKSSTIALNFKFISTKILRTLTINKRTSFSSYWIFSCFIDEYFQFLIDFTTYYKRPNITKRTFHFKKPKV